MQILKTYMAGLSTEARQSFADEVGSTPDHLMHQIGGGHRKASPELARRIETASKGAVPKHELRPDIWSAAESEAA